MMSAGLRAAIMDTPPTTRLPGAFISLDFLRQKYWVNNVCYRDLLAIPGVSFTRASIAYARGRDDILRPFASGVPAITDRGLLLRRGTTTNSILYSRDWTQAGSWTATNITTALNAVGMDGQPNSATTLTATAGNGTILQVPTASVIGWSVGIKRKTGSGNIDLSIDGGSTWTTQTISSTAWSWVTKTGSSGAGVGVRIVTSGDEVYVDFGFAQSDTSGAVAPGAPTTSSTATVAGDALSLPWVRNGTPLSLHGSFERQDAASSSNYGLIMGSSAGAAEAAFIRDDVVRARVASVNVYNQSSGGTPVPPGQSTTFSLDAATQYASLDGAATISTTSSISLPGSTTVVGNGNATDPSHGGTFWRSIAVWNYPIGFGDTRNACLRLPKTRAF